MMIPLFKGKVPKQYCELKAIVCHSGTMNYGHYYCLVNKMRDNAMVMYKFNDSTVSMIDTPIN